MAEDEFGAAVCEVFQFLTYFFEDLQGLFASAEQRFSDLGWECRKRQGSALSQWVFHRDLYFLYSPTGASKKFDHAVLFQGRLAPYENFVKHPLLLGVAVAFEKSTEIDFLWSGWKKEGGLRVMKYLMDKSPSQQLPKDILNPEFAIDAFKGSGLVMPLCSFKNAEDVNIGIVEPMTRCLELIGYKGSVR